MELIVIILIESHLKQPFTGYTWCYNVYHCRPFFSVSTKRPRWVYSTEMFHFNIIQPTESNMPSWNFGGAVWKDLGRATLLTCALWKPGQTTVAHMWPCCWWCMVHKKAHRSLARSPLQSVPTVMRFVPKRINTLSYSCLRNKESHSWKGGPK